VTKGRLYVISGASGAGKNTVINRTMEKRPDLFYSISATTRPPRSGEIDGIHYYFVDHDKFEQMIENNELLEYTNYVGNYYGTPIAAIREKTSAGTDVIMDIDIPGAMQVKKILPESVLIFVLPPKFSDLEDRIRSRCTNTDADIAKRIETAKTEYSFADKYDYLIVNDTPDNAADEILAIMKAEQCKVAYRLDLIATDR